MLKRERSWTIAKRYFLISFVRSFVFSIAKWELARGWEWKSIAARSYIAGN